MWFYLKATPDFQSQNKKRSSLEWSSCFSNACHDAGMPHWPFLLTFAVLVWKGQTMPLLWTNYTLLETGQNWQAQRNGYCLYIKLRKNKNSLVLNKDPMENCHIDSQIWSDCNFIQSTQEWELDTDTIYQTSWSPSLMFISILPTYIC